MLAEVTWRAMRKLGDERRMNHGNGRRPACLRWMPSLFLQAAQCRKVLKFSWFGGPFLPLPGGQSLLRSDCIHQMARILLPRHKEVLNVE